MCVFVCNLLVCVCCSVFRTKYSRMNQVNFLKADFYKFEWSILEYFVSFVLQFFNCCKKIGSFRMTS